MDSQRRHLLRWLAASPLLAALPAQRLLAQAEPGALLDAATDALDVFDFARAAEAVVPPAHWGYLMSGVDGEATLRANTAAFARYQLLARRMVDVSKMDLGLQLFGRRYASPLVLCPVGSLGAFHAEADVAVARAARRRGHLQMLSTVSSRPVEQVAEAGGQPPWFQLYTTNRPEALKQLLRRAEGAGCTVVAVTIDTPNGRNTVTATRAQRADDRVCANCHVVGPNGRPRPNLAAKPNFAGIDTQGLGQTDATLTWDFLKRLKDQTTMKVLLKGIEAEEDAALALRHGADGLIVSNHGGRAIESGRGTLESLPAVVRGVRGRIPVLLDGGVRRGTDVYKALALGATAVGIGRPYVWGLASFGEEGVARVIDLLDAELRLAMVGCGARRLSEITQSTLIDTRN
jgi:isopentenyl diphosphate isomerase/L-lactate dehydrogenase-like FMN-dependent dehydrogenase